MRLNSESFADMDSRFRATLANALSGYKPANLIGSCNERGDTNLAIMSSAVHLGSHPPLLSIVIRPDSVERHTLGNILATGCFTINHVSHAMIEAAHQTAARYPTSTSEFAATGLNATWEDNFAAPFVAESPVRLGLQLREHHHLAINDTNLVIGEIVLALLPDGSVSDTGELDMGMLDTVAISGLDTYHQCEPLKQMAYAKPDVPPRIIRQWSS